MFLSSEGVYVDAVDLFACGWTESLIQKFLGEEDGRAPVDHYKNFQGKRLWKMSRVAIAERSEDFHDAFAVSVARRSLTPRQVRGYLEARRVARQTIAFLVARGRAANH
jgi:hypothetical protein